VRELPGNSAEVWAIPHILKSETCGADTLANREGFAFRKSAVALCNLWLDGAIERQGRKMQAVSHLR
jgi:hypothetical protein